jgi:hypothetical protein
MAPEPYYARRSVDHGPATLSINTSDEGATFVSAR